LADFDDLIEDLKKTRDELRVQINLASREIKDEWEELEGDMKEFMEKTKDFAGDAGFRETGEGVGKALAQVGHELKLGFDRIRDALKED
jgi:chromosome segregation ATPase